MRIVLDTNVLIAAFIAIGKCSALFEHCVRNHLLITSDFILNEFREKLTQKFRFTPDEAGEATTLFLQKTLVVNPVKLPTPVSRDPDDDNVLATALAGNCDCIITGDKDLLVLQRSQEIDIVRPENFPEYESSL